MAASKQEQEFANNNHANWLNEAPTQRVLGVLKAQLLSMPVTVTSQDSREHFYAQSLQKAGIVQAIQLIETKPYPQMRG